MSFVRPYLTAGLAVAKRDLLLFLSYRTFFASQLFQAVFTLALFYYLSRLVSIGEFPTSDDYFAFVVVGVAVLQVITSTLMALPNRIRQELVAGTFERVLVSPLGPVGAIFGMMVFPFLFSLVVATFMMLMATTFFGLPLQWSTAALTLPTALLIGLAFAPFALLLAAATVAIKQTTGAAAAILALFSLVGGFYFPVTLLPDWIQWASDVQPFTPALDLMRHLLIGTPLIDAAWGEAAKLVGSATIFLALSVWVLRGAIGVGQRRGTIIEY